MQKRQGNASFLSQVLAIDPSTDPNGFPHFLDSIIENIPDMIFVKDARDLRFVRFNKAGEKLLGYTKEDLIGKTDYDFFSKEEADFFTAKDRDVLAKGKMLEIPEEPIHTRLHGIRTLNTKKIPIYDKHGEPQYLLGISRDITEKIKANLELMESENRWRSLVENAPDFILTVLPNGTIQFINRTLPPLTPKDVIGKTIYEFIPKKDQEMVQRALSYVFRTGNSTSYETTSIGPTPETWYITRVGPIKNGNRVIGATLIASDITNRRNVEKTILDTTRQEQQKIGQFIHDGLVQDLAGISLMAKALEKRFKPTSNLEKHQIQAISKLVTQCISKARDLAHGLQPVDLAPSGLMSALETLSINTEKLFGLKCKFTNDDPILFDDNIVATHIYLIAKEAIHNAIKHGSPNHINISFKRKNGKTILQIDDDGLGFSNKSSENKGKGMGLSIMRYRAKIINASLKIKENKQGGITVKCVI